MSLPNLRTPEYSIQIQLVRILRARGWVLFHVPNQLGRGQPALRQMGLEPGIPDLIVIAPRQIVIEIKAKGGVVRPAQRFWLNKFQELGWVVVTGNSVTAILDQLPF